MPWRVEYLSETNVVAISAVGEVSNEDAEAQVAEALRFLQQHQTTLVLADYTQAFSEISLPSLYGMPDHFTREGGFWNIRVAVLMPRSQYRLESYQFFELVCRNAGYNVRLFKEREAAEAWLEQARPHHAESNSPSAGAAGGLVRTTCG